METDGELKKKEKEKYRKKGIEVQENGQEAGEQIMLMEEDETMKEYKDLWRTF